MKRLTSALVAMTLLLITEACASTNGTSYTNLNPVTNNGVEEAVHSYFSDIPIMSAIARCESGYVHFDPDEPTGLLTNPAPNSSASGVFQILLITHGPEAARLGFDIKTVEGQLGYARHLYEKNGTRDWNASKHCWG